MGNISRHLTVGVHFLHQTHSVNNRSWITSNSFNHPHISFPSLEKIGWSGPVSFAEKFVTVTVGQSWRRGPSPSEDPVPMWLQLFGQRDSQPLEWLFTRQKWHFSVLGIIEFLDDLRNFLLLESSVTALQFRKISADLFSCYVLWEYFCWREANKFHLGFSYM